MRRQPGFVAVAAATLALGIGASAAIFGVADAVLLRRLPYPKPEQLVTVWDTHEAQGRDHEHPSPGNFLDWAAMTRAFQGMTAWQDGSGASMLRHADAPAVVETVKVTPAFFRVLGVPAAHGRTFETFSGASFSVADRFATGDRVLVMSHRLWTSRFGADPGLVGQAIALDGVPWMVVGIMPPDFDLPRPSTELWLAWDIAPSFAGFAGGPPRDYRFLNVLARLRPEVSLEEAQADVRALAATLAEAHPRANAGWSARVVSLEDEREAQARPAVLLLAGAVGLALLLACANVASLQLARGTARRREIAVHQSLGASRLQVVRQLLAESLLLGLLGGAAGLVVAHGLFAAILAAPPVGFPGLEGVSLDGRVVAFATLLAIASAMLFGVAPALEASDTPMHAVLSDGGRAATRGPRTGRARRLLIVGQVAVALALLTGAGLVGKSFVRVLSVDPGFDPRDLLTLRITLDQASYRGGAEAREFYRVLMPRLLRVAGVSGAAGVTALPMSPIGTDFARPYWREGEPDLSGNAPKADIRMVTPGYFDVMRMSLRRGRAFNEWDGPSQPRVVVVNETLARRVWTDEDPIGRHLVLDYLGGAYPYEVIGVVNDVRFAGPKAAPRPEVFIPHAQNPYLDLTVVVRAAGEPSALLRAVQREVAAVDRMQPVHAIATMESLMSRSVATDRFAALLLGLLATLAVVLVGTGIYGLVAFLVAQRTPEIGLRLALGAPPHAVVGLLMTESLRLALAGCVVGLPLAGFVSRSTAGLIYGVRPSDPLIWGAALLAVLGVAVVASVVPARQAARLEPLVAIRSE